MRVTGATGQDVVDLVQNDPNGQVGSLFTAENFGSGAAAGTGLIDWGAQPPMTGTTSGGLTGEGTLPPKTQKELSRIYGTKCDALPMLKTKG